MLWLFVALSVIGHFVTFIHARPTLLAHRGSPESFPEHTFPGYQLAQMDRCDFIEIDVQSTRDHELVIIHSPNLGEVTDVAERPKFASRKVENFDIGGQLESGWLVHTFSLGEIRELKVKERYSFRNHMLDGYFGIMTLQEFLDWIRILEKQGIIVQVCFEMKFPSFYRAMGLPLEEPTVALLKSYGYLNVSVEVERRSIIESFEIGGVLKMRELVLGEGDLSVGIRFDFFQLISGNLSEVMNDTGVPYAWYLSEAGLHHLRDAGFEGVAVGGSAVDAGVVQLVHLVGLRIFMYTLRSDVGVGWSGVRRTQPLVPESNETPEDRFRKYLIEYNIDGAFVEDLLLAEEILEPRKKSSSLEWVFFAVGLSVVFCLAFCIVVVIAVLFRRFGRAKQEQQEENRPSAKMDKIYSMLDDDEVV